MLPQRSSGLALAGALGVAIFAACSGPGSAAPAAALDGGPPDAAPEVTATDASDDRPARPDRFDVPVEGATPAEIALFNEGDNLFEVPLHEADGLGPLYTRSACGACHASGVRGPGAIEKMAVVEADGITPSPDQATLLPFGSTTRPLTAAGATTPILPPSDPSVLTSFRVGPPILGRGYIEAVRDDEITRVAAEQAARTDAIHGRVNHVTYASEATADARFNPHAKGDTVIGRFGLKARIATVDDFTADALQGDMGVTTPLRPSELPNPDALTDDEKAGVDVGVESVHKRAMYVRLTAIPAREVDARGEALFAATKCAACHVPAMKTRADYPIHALAGVDAPIYSDLLLHDMGDALADGVVEGEAGSRDWRTAPLIGLRFLETYLHDGRATSIEQAIELHGGEAAESAALFSKLSPGDRAALLSFVRAL